MLSANFKDIMEVVLPKIESNTLDSLPVEHVRDLSYMLLGYLRLMNLGFSTPSDTPEDKDYYYSHLKMALFNLAEFQNQRIKKTVETLQAEIEQELQSVLQMLEQYAQVFIERAPEKSIKKQLAIKLKSFVEMTHKFQKKFARLLREGLPFFANDKALINALFSFSAQWEKEALFWGEKDRTGVLGSKLQSFDGYIHELPKKIIIWNAISTHNNQCFYYGMNGEMIDYLEAV